MHDDHGTPCLSHNKCYAAFGVRRPDGLSYPWVCRLCKRRGADDLKPTIRNEYQELLLQSQLLFPEGGGS